MIADEIVVVFEGAIAGADGIDRDFIALGGGDGLFESGAAGVVFAVTDDDEHARDGFGLSVAGQLTSGKLDRIPEGGAPAGREFVDGVGD